MSEFHRLAVGEVVAETADAVSVVFEVPAELAERYTYRPGQFLTLRVPGPDEGWVARCYSLCSSPEQGPGLKITVKRVADGWGSNWICDRLRPGMSLDVLPPAGLFTPRRWDRDLLLIAGGSGITPVMSILRAALARGSARLALLYANRDERSVIFAAELRELVAAHPDRLVVLHWLESVQGLPGCAALAELVRPFAGREVFLCGPAAFMDTTCGALAELGVPRERLHIERFRSLTEDPFETPAPARTATSVPSTATSAPSEVAVADAEEGEGAPLSADGPASTVAVELDGERHTLRWPAGTKLLDLLREHGLDAPFSCREGACSACACRITAGEVKMLRNEVLDQCDLDEGYILACQALPVTDSVEVTYD